MLTTIIPLCFEFGDRRVSDIFDQVFVIEFIKGKARMRIIHYIDQYWVCGDDVG